MIRKKLTKKQQVFVEEFLRTWKPAEAARAAGYKHPDTQGCNILKAPLVAEYVNQRMSEISMETDEVLTRLTQQARVNLGDFLIVNDWYDPDLKRTVKRVLVNWEKVIEYGYLIKELNWSRRGDPVLKLHDSQAALTLIGKARRMFVEQVEETHHLDQANINIYIPDNGRNGAADVEEDDHGE